MNLALLLELAAGLSVLITVAAFLLIRATRVQDRMDRRLRAVRARTLDLAPPAAPGPGGLLQIVAAIGSGIARSGLLSSGTLAEFQQTLINAGFRGGQGLGLFVGSKLLLLLALPAAAQLLAHSRDMAPMWHWMTVGGAAVIGLLLPDFIVKRKRAAQLAALERGMPDALDLLVICSEAGLSLEPAIERVAREIIAAHPVVAEELRLTDQALKMTSDRRTALLDMGRRSGLPSLQRLSATLVQSLQFGTPLSQALRVLSAEMRTEMLTAFEARAAKLPVMLTVPMILFILPTLFLIVIGPAAVQFFKAQ
jgi:tight adherence protein C